MQQHFFRLAGLWAGATHFKRVHLSIGLLLGLWMGSLLGGHANAWARAPLYATAAVSDIAVADLPKQGQVVYQQIQQGGAFAFDKDGSVFGNYEQRLPRQARGYYREYTVSYNAASRSRGPRRIVCGGWQMRSPDACYYSPDHYNSFLRITPAQLRPSERIKAPTSTP
mgnify:CR=1 FL=1|jgi:ribonuclease T1